MSINEGFLIKTSTSTSASPSSSKSPYQIAVENGYEGTEAEFNNALTKIDQVIYYEEKGNPEGVASLGDDGKVPYFQLPDFIKTEDKGKVGGVASLGDDGKVPTSQLPDMDYIPTSQKGTANGVANLNAQGKIPTTLLPDDIGGGGVGEDMSGKTAYYYNASSVRQSVTCGQGAEKFNDYRTPSVQTNNFLSVGNNAIGEYSHVTGTKNVAHGKASYALGEGNIVNGEATGALGYNNKVGTGSNNEPFETGLSYSCVVGYNNQFKGGGGFIVGGVNSVESGAGMVSIFGDSNNVSAGSGYCLGNANTIKQGNTNILFGISNKVGTGTSATSSNTEFNICSGYYNEIKQGKKNYTTGANNTHEGGDYNFIEGYSNTSSGSYCHVGGKGNNCSGTYNYVVGEDNVATGRTCHVEGSNNTSSGYYSFISGLYNTEQSGMGSFVTGNGNNCKASNALMSGMNNAITASYDGIFVSGMNCSAQTNCIQVIGRANKISTTASPTTNKNGDVFVVGNGTVDASTVTRSNAFRVTYSGAVYGLSAFNSSGADYAEYFEWLDGNPNNQDRVGYFVALVDDKIVLANSGDYILGVVSGQPCIIGNSDEDWLGRWEHDEFDRFIKEYLEDTEVEVEVPEDEEEKMKLLSQPNYRLQDDKIYRIDTTVVDYETPSWRYKENPNYNPDQQYIERKDRKEWSAIGMMGVLAVRDDGSCSVNGYCKVDNGGTATSANEYIPGQTWRVIKRVSENVIKIIFK